MRRTRRVAIDSHDLSALRGVARRTLLVRVVLAAAAVALLTAAVAEARSLDVQKRTIVPRGTTAVVVLDLSLSIGEGNYVDVRSTLRRVIDAQAPVGLVVFSDVPYELLPPGTPGNELRPILNVLVPARPGEPASPWTGSFRAGTRISEALGLAGAMLRRERVQHGSILLLSDLQTAPDDIAALTRTLEQLKSSSVAVRVVPMGALSDGRLLFGQLLGQQAFITQAELQGEPARPLRTTQTGALPVGLLALMGLFFVALAANERFAARLALPRRSEGIA